MPRLIPLAPEELTSAERIRTLHEEANLATVLAAYDALVSGGDTTEIDRVYSPGYRDYASTVPGGDLDALKAFITGFHATFPESTIRMNRVLVDGSYVVVHTTARRTPDQEWDEVMEIFRVDDGLVAAHWEVIEPSDLMSGSK